MNRLGAPPRDVHRLHLEAASIERHVERCHCCATVVRDDESGSDVSIFFLGTNGARRLAGGPTRVRRGAPTVAAPPDAGGSTGTTGGGGGGGQGTGPGSGQGPVGKITNYIPTEIVTVYVATTAAIADSTTGSRAGQWAAFWVDLCVTPLAVWAVAAGQARGQGAQFKVPWIESAIAVVAFAAWGFTLTGTPFADFGWYKSSVGTVVLLGVTFVLGLVGPMLSPPQEA